MSYQAARGPRIFFGVIAIGVAGLFAIGAISAVWPALYEEYQRAGLRNCEEHHGLHGPAWQPIYGFDWGGRYLVGDGPDDRALIECIVASQTVDHVETTPYGPADGTHPVLAITSGAFTPGLQVTYYPGESATGGTLN